MGGWRNGKPDGSWRPGGTGESLMLVSVSLS
jgi:hypothetical protein